MLSGRPDRQLHAEVPGGSIAGWQADAGPGVLILHGEPGLSDYTGPLAAEFEDAFRVIRCQQRGLAPSVTSGPFDIDRHVADAVAVLDAAGARRAYVVGYSWGGHLAMHLAVRCPDRLLGLVLADPVGAVPDGGAGDLERILAARIPPERAAGWTSGPWPATAPPRTPWKPWPSCGPGTSRSRTRLPRCRRLACPLTATPGRSTRSWIFRCVVLIGRER